MLKDLKYSNWLYGVYWKTNIKNNIRRGLNKDRRLFMLTQS